MLLEARDITVCYKTGDFRGIGLKEYVLRHIKGEYKVNNLLAVVDVSFSLEDGDLLGIIGTNGSGKSTLLKIIAGILEPVKGSVRARGSIVALLELNSGFDPDLTIKENAYLFGAMLGYTRDFMDENYNNIIEFAELEYFQDLPYKQLSTGMQSRLAFSVAAWVQPDILILDEVLSVGDGAFRKKSEAKMKEIIARGSATILVSHSLEQIRGMCNKVLWMDHGKNMAFGETREICDRYAAFLEGKS